MSTSTARLQLTKPVGSDSMAVGMTQLSDAYTKIDTAIGKKSAATTGAVASPFNGYLLKETSTGQSKIYTGAVWENFWDPNDGKGNFQQGDFPVATGVGVSETEITHWLFNVVAGRKYKVDVSLAISAIDPDISIGGPSVLHGYFRNNFKWTTNINGTPGTLIHDVASYYSKDTSAASKNLRFFFEFYPNVTQQIKVNHTALVLSGDEWIRFNLSGANSNMYLVDWGV